MRIDEGNSDSMACYGKMLEDGRGVYPDLLEALAYYKTGIKH